MAIEELAHSGMNRRQMLRGAMLGAGAGLAGLPFAASPIFAAQDQAWPAVSGFVSSYVDPVKVANMLVMLGQRDVPPQVIASGVDTLGRDRRADADSLYRIYSMTKPITGMAAMILIEEGKLALDQPLHSILPKFERMMVQKVYDGGIGPDDLEPAVRPITIRHMLTHTAGLGYSLVQEGPIRQLLIDREVVPGQVTKLDLPQFLRGKPADSLEIFADRAAEIPLVRQPGTRWSYSIGLDLMGRVIEAVSGQPFDEFLQERIFDPVGMGSTYFRVPESEIWRFTTNYAIYQDTLLPLDPAESSIYLEEPPFPFGGAGLVSSPRDYDRFLHMLANSGTIGGRRVMSEETVRVGTSDILPETMDPEDEVRKNYGYGAGGRVGFGPFKGVFGWAGAAGTLGFVDMKSGLRVGQFSQVMPGMAYPILDELPQAIADDLAAQQGGA